MARYETNQEICGQHPQIAFTISHEPQFSLEWLTRYFETEIVKGVQYKPLQTVQIGWLPVQLRENGSFLELWEPQFDSLPIKWRPGVDNVVRHLILQKSVCEELGVDPVFPSCIQPGIVSPSFLKDATEDRFSMSRDLVSGRDSGWVFHDIGYFGEEGEFKSLYEISLCHMGVIPFLALPPETNILRQDASIRVSWREKHISSETNDLLRKLVASPILV
jgi:hypothetical protein